MLVLGKARSLSEPNLGCRGAESPGWFDILPKNCRRCDTWAGMLLWWSCQSPVAHSCGLLSHLSNCHGGVFKLNTKFDADSLLYLLSHFENDGRTVHTLTQRRLAPPLTSTVKSSLFTHTHSSPLSLAARLQGCCADCYCYINNSWTFSRQTLYIKYIYWLDINHNYKIWTFHAHILCAGTVLDVT